VEVWTPALPAQYLLFKWRPALPIHCFFPGWKPCFARPQANSDSRSKMQLYTRLPACLQQQKLNLVKQNQLVATYTFKHA